MAARQPRTRADTRISRHKTCATPPSPGCSWRWMIPDTFHEEAFQLAVQGTAGGKSCNSRTAPALERMGPFWSVKDMSSNAAVSRPRHLVRRTAPPGRRPTRCPCRMASTRRRSNAGPSGVVFDQILQPDGRSAIVAASKRATSASSQLRNLSRESSPITSPIRRFAFCPPLRQALNAVALAGDPAGVLRRGHVPC